MCEQLEPRRLLAVDFQGIVAWTEQGPGPITLSSGFIQAGAIEAVVVDPADSNNIYVGTVNGGVWRTATGTYSPTDGVDNDGDSVVDNAEEYPAWEPLTDQFGSLSISDLAMSPLDAATLYAGTGRTSAGFGDGGSAIGVLRTTDGGNNWMQVGPELLGLRIRSVVPTGVTDPISSQEIVLVASDSGSGGVFRSVDGGTSFNLLSGSAGSSDGLDNDGDGSIDEGGELNLPAGAASHLEADPGNPNRYYAAVPQVGVFRSDDAGASWQLVNGTGANVLGGLGAGNFRTELAVHNSGGTNVVYAAVMRSDVALPPPFNPRTNRVFAMYRSTDMGTNWRQLQNMPVINPGAQAGAHFAMIAHPTNPNVLYVGGDAPDPSLAPPQMTRYRFAANDATPALDAWQLVADSGTIDNSRPHADARDFAFANDANGNLSLVGTDDGGIYRLFDPDLTMANRRWDSMNGDIRVTESYSVAYDALNGTLVTGTQDNGTSRQRDTGDPLFPFDWNLIQGCDGGVVWADNDQAAHPNQTLIYTTAQNFTACGGTQLRTIDNANMEVSSPALALAVNGTAGRTLIGPGTLGPAGALVFDNTLQFIQPYALNEVDPTRMIIGTNFLYESLDQGATLTSLGGLIDLTNNGIDDDGDAVPDPDPDEWAPANPVGAVWQAPYPQSTPIAYGGTADAMVNPDVLWVGAGGNLLLRTTPGGLPAVLPGYTSAGGGPVADVVMDPDDWRTAYIVDLNGSVFRAVSNNAGSSVAFTNITGNLPEFTTDLRTIEFIATGSSKVVLLGGQNGVYRAINPDGGNTQWSEFGGNLPNAPVNDLQYYDTSLGDVLVVGLFGRGVWKIDNASLVADQQGVVNICGDDNQINQDDEILLRRNQGNPLLLDVFVNNVLQLQTPMAAVHQINVFGQGGNDTLIVDTTYGLIDVPEGIRYDGDGLCWDLEDDGPLVGLDRGFDTLVVTQADGDEQATEFLYVGSLPGSGRHVLTDVAGGVQTIDFEELEPILTDVPAAAFALTSLPDLASMLDQANTVEVRDARILPDGTRVTIDNFEPIEFSQKQDVTVDTAAGDDTIFVGNALSDGVLVALTIDAGTGQDRVYVERVYDMVATTIRGGAEDDVLDASLLFANAVTLQGQGGHDLLIGGGGNDTLDGGTGNDLLEGRGGDNFLVGGGDFDTVVVQGTSGADILTISQNSAISLTTVLNGDTRDDTLAFLEAIRVDAMEGADTIAVNQADAMVANPSQSLPVWVWGGSGSAIDRLVIRDDGLGDLVVVREAFDGHSGSVSVGPLAAIDYSGIEKLSVTPLDSATGATGDDGLGRLAVFRPDRFELNDARLVSTHLGIAPLFLSEMTITPGTVLLPGPFGNVPGDEDWFEFMPRKTGTYRIDVLFEQIIGLPNGRAGLPNDGDLNVGVFDNSGTQLATGVSTSDNESVEVSMLADQRYFVRVYGLDDAVNVYDLNIVEVDLLGPRVDALTITGQLYDLFDPKPSTDGPTPPITSLTIAITDPPPRAPGDLYPALDAAIAQHPGHYLLVGDHHGPIAMAGVVVVNDPPVVGLPATATIELLFDHPLPDDRYTLRVSDALVDPAQNQLDGETNAIQPLDLPQLPSGDGVSGGEFVARFTVDSRPEIGVTASTRIYVDANGNFEYDPQGDGDTTNTDLVFHFGLESDAFFAGNFAAAAAVQASGFQKLGAFGFDPFSNVYRFLLDLDHNGIADLYSPVPGLARSSLPVAGDFDPAHPGDEIGLFTGDRWYLDTNGDNILDVTMDTVIDTAMRGLPAVGDVNGDGTDDLIVFDAGSDLFYFDLNRDGVVDDSLNFGLPDFLERPAIGDLNLDGVDDLGFWVAGSDQKIGEGKAEWHFLISDVAPPPNPAQLASTLFEPYSPHPLGNDLFANFGDRYSLPIFGNFDPPVVTGGEAEAGHLLSYHNHRLPCDVDGNGLVSPRDALIVITRLNQTREGVVPDVMVQYESVAPYWDVSGDRRLSPIDALVVISYLNRLDAGNEPEGESVEPANSSESQTIIPDEFETAFAFPDSESAAAIEHEAVNDADEQDATELTRFASSVEAAVNIEAWMAGEEDESESVVQRDDIIILSEELLDLLSENVIDFASRAG